MSLQFEPKVSLGNILALVMIIVSTVVGYTRLAASHQNLQDQVDTLVKDSKDLRDLKYQYSLQEFQIRVVGEKLEEIKLDVKEIKRFIK
jgi:hypothetical protein